jgi:hypothetical protein
LTNHGIFHIVDTTLHNQKPVRFINKVRAGSEWGSFTCSGGDYGLASILVPDLVSADDLPSRNGNVAPFQKTDLSIIQFGCADLRDFAPGFWAVEHTGC